MKILFSELPKQNWWGKGTPVYENNWAMTDGVIPDQEIVLREYNQILQTLQKFAEVEIIPFPAELDTNQLYKHDAIFIRDTFVSNQKGEMVISNFSEKKRQPEIEHVKKYLEEKNYKLHALSEDTNIEGGECYFAKQENILFSGVSRSNRKGVEEAGKLLRVSETLIVETNAFHMDTVFTIILDKSGKLSGVIACLKLIKNADAIRQFTKSHNIELIEIDPIDSIDFDGKGKLSVNCLALPGVLLGGDKFVTTGVEEKIQSLGIDHVITPTSQFLFSAAGYHCLTNELMS